jgi:peptidoglycan/xylan/chitin deacetylase (PgdA/CDA1 family)/SAM-dependent methyltransferase
MTRLGTVVTTGRGPATAATLDSLVRARLDEVVVVTPPTVGARLLIWLRALVGQRGWALVESESAGIGGQLSDGLARASSEWLMTLTAGECLVRQSVPHLRRVLAANPSSGFVAAAARVVAQDIDDVLVPVDVTSPAAFDPADPCLRAVCWHRPTMADAGGFDRDLTSTPRYDLWLRLLSRGVSGEAMSAPVVEVPVAPASALYEEISADAHGAEVGAVHERHRALLEAHAIALLLARAERVARLGARHAGGEQAPSAAAAMPGPLPAASHMGRRASPLSLDWGYDRGGPLDRIYIEQFIEANAGDVRGAVLEVQEPGYSTRFGGRAVTRIDVLDIDETNVGATILADLRAVAHLPDSVYDCIVLTQTLHVIPEMTEAVAECHRLLRPGGVLLATLPALSRVCLEYGRDGDFWRVTPAGARRLFEPVFGVDVEITTFGNVLAGSAFLHGVGAAEAPRDMDIADPYNPTLVGVRARKAGAAQAPGVIEGRRDSGLVLLYHRVQSGDPDPHEIAVTPDAFAGQMAWLARHCAVLPLDALLDGAMRRRLPPRAVAITFDDGYLDTLETAAPCLSRLRLPATCFVATVDLDGPHVFWWDRLAAALLDGDAPPALTVTLAGRDWRFATGTPGERVLAHSVLYTHAREATPADRSRLLADLVAWRGGDATPARCRRLTADELRSLTASGVTLGAHSVTHPLMTHLSRAQQLEEIAASTSHLERLAGSRVTGFAYPFGAVDDAVREAAREAGVRCAFTCEPRALSRRDDLWRLPRVDARTQPIERFGGLIDSLLAGDAR